MTPHKPTIPEALQRYVSFAATRRTELGSLSDEMEAVDAFARAALAQPASQEQWQTAPKDDTGEQWLTVPKASLEQAKTCPEACRSPEKCCNFACQKASQEQAQQPMCKCGDRPADECDEEWGPNCDLGNNPAHVKVAQQPSGEVVTVEHCEYTATRGAYRVLIWSPREIKTGTLLTPAGPKPEPMVSGASEAPMAISLEQHEQLMRGVSTLNYGRAVESHVNAMWAGRLCAKPAGQAAYPEAIAQLQMAAAQFENAASIPAAMQRAENAAKAAEIRAAISALSAGQAGGEAAKAWAEGYRAGVEDERISEANIGTAGFGAKVEPSRQNPYATPATESHDMTAMLERGAKAWAGVDAQELRAGATQAEPAMTPEQVERVLDIATILRRGTRSMATLRDAADLLENVYLHMRAAEPARVPQVDDLAQFIRQIDGNHTMGAGAMAERICEWLTAAQAKGGA